MERIEKVISSQTGYSRKDIKKMIQEKRVLVNGDVILKAGVKVDGNNDLITIDGKEIKIKKNVYLMMNKPKGYISATEDRHTPTVLDLVPQEYLHRELFPAGRLDKDTTGLMIITDDGNFAHNILSPQKHVKKTYVVTIDLPVTEEMVEKFTQGIVLSDGQCKTASLEIISTYTAIVVLIEGRYHQIKRMFGCFGAKVLELKRIGIGNFKLPNNLKLEECREFTEEELKKVQEQA